MVPAKDIISSLYEGMIKKIMNEELTVMCPYCGEGLIIEPEPNDNTITYVEDCHVCCNPILITVSYSEEGSSAWASREND